MNTQARPIGRSLLLLLSVLSAGLLPASLCNQSALPGTSLGTYSVVGTLGTNTCGTTLNPTNPWDFSVEMSEDGTTLYLAQTDGSNELSGTLASSSTTMTSTVTSVVDGDGGSGTCALTNNTSWTVKLASGTTPASFTGTVSYTYSAATGVSATVNCTDQLTSAGGQYATLPCTVNYTLAGTHNN